MTMKQAIILSACMLVTVFVSPYANAAVVLSDDIQAQINQAVAQAPVVYEIDKEQSTKQMERMDTWFEAQVDTKQAVGRTSKNGIRQSFRRTMEKNMPIAAAKDGKLEKSIDAGKSFDMFYIKKPMQRLFKKSIVKPAQTGLEEAEVVELGKTFIQTHQLCPLEENDGLGEAVVVDRKKRAIDDQSRQEYVVSQKVQFTRNFKGQEVINARQSVEIHPESKEILGFKIKDWGVIKPGSEKTAARKTMPDMMKTFDDNFKKSTRTFQAHKIKTAYYQTENRLIPVVLVTFDVMEAKDDEAIPEEETLVVSLAKDIEIKSAEKTRRVPKE